MFLDDFFVRGSASISCAPNALKNLLIEFVFLAALKPLNQTKQHQDVGKPFIQIADNREVVRDKLEDTEGGIEHVYQTDECQTKDKPARPAFG